MTIEDQIKDEKLQYDINGEVAKISALSSGKIDKYEYLTGEEILPSNQQQIIQQAKSNYSPLGKAFEGTNITYDFRKFKTIRAFGNEITNNVIDTNTANEEQNELLEYINRLRFRTKPNNPESKKLKKKCFR